MKGIRSTEGKTNIFSFPMIGLCPSVQSIGGIFAHLITAHVLYFFEKVHLPPHIYSEKVFCFDGRE
ncbi:MAG: hypothetical protein ACI8QD_002471 [Cyclobacteriaceae bacterium]|jgi:hypothetical protein